MKTLYRILAICLPVLLITACTGRAKDAYKNLSADDFERLIDDKQVQCVDVRTVAEYSEGHIAGSLNINVLDKSFADNAEELLNPKHPVAVYCKSGRRSRNAAEQLSRKGYTVYNLDKGFEGWKQSGKAVEK